MQLQSERLWVHFDTLFLLSAFYNLYTQLQLESYGSRPRTRQLLRYGKTERQ